MTNLLSNSYTRGLCASSATARAVLIAFLVAGVFPSTALAQTSTASQGLADAQVAAVESLGDLRGNPPARWQEAYPYQFKALMRAPVDQARHDALAALIALVQRPGYEEALKAPEAARVLVPELLEVYNSGRRPAERKMAATAICLIGTEEDGIETLSALSEKDYDRTVQRHVQRAITGYYFRTYPELAEWIAGRNGKRTLITKAQIEHARRRQARADRIAAKAVQEKVVLGASEEQKGQQKR